MKKFIQQTIKEKIANNETPAISFRTRFDDMGHIQLDKHNHWGIFFNAKCVHISNTLASAVKKLDRLNVIESDFIV